MHELLPDLPISFFENALSNVPSQQTTLRRMVRTRYYQAAIEAIRAEPDKAKQDEMKSRLPAFSPVALLHHRKRNTTPEDKIAQQHPFLMADVDKKDNPNVDMAELKTHLCRLPYVLLCAYSVRGGLWFIVHLPHSQTPVTLAAHHRYLQKLFKDKLKVNLDSTKGGNAHDLRFVSYDPEPYINKNPSVMTGTYTPPPPRPKAYTNIRYAANDDSKLLNRILKPVQSAGDGERHTCLLKAAKLAGGYIAAGRLDEDIAVCAFETVVSDWPNFSKSQKTIRDGIRYGQNEPIYSEDKVEQWQAPLRPIHSPASNTSKPVSVPIQRTEAPPMRPAVTEIPTPQPQPQPVPVVADPEPETFAPTLSPEEQALAVFVRKNKAVKNLVNALELEVIGVRDLSEPLPPAVRWDTAELETFFSNLVLPSEPFYINGRTIKPDVITKFIQSHLAYVKHNASHRGYECYYRRLVELRNLFTQHQIHVIEPIIADDEGDYPKEWDSTDQEQRPPELVVSPRRADFAAKLNVSEASLKLFTFKSNEQQ